MIAARALGLDCTPFAPPDPARLDREFFVDGRAKVNVVCNLGYGDPESAERGAPAPSLEMACRPA
jgi:3-hydroxypropanoate dehydrogenase